MILQHCFYMVKRNLDTLIAIDLEAVLLNNDPLVTQGLGLSDNALQIKDAFEYRQQGG